MHKIVGVTTQPLVPEKRREARASRGSDWGKIEERPCPLFFQPPPGAGRRHLSAIFQGRSHVLHFLLDPPASAAAELQREPRGAATRCGGPRTPRGGHRLPGGVVWPAGARALSAGAVFEPHGGELQRPRTQDADSGRRATPPGGLGRRARDCLLGHQAVGRRDFVPARAARRAANALLGPPVRQGRAAGGHCLSPHRLRPGQRPGGVGTRASDVVQHTRLLRHLAAGRHGGD